MRRRRKVIEKGYNYVMCQNSIEEIAKHLFFDCPSIVSRWFVLGIIWEENLSIYQWLYQTKQAFVQAFFMKIFMIGAWCLWNQRNAFIFNRKPPCLAAWKADFKSLVKDHLIRIKPVYHSSIKLWLRAL
jgi:hypothetical protein